ncbi:hypothetical protein [Haloarcula onubensis]|uniref:ASCH domain-containing protein n=1 Tax=Haloarcula onubensis TaxID=2950539 RepID=A0ABU2FWV2_9EURY|nr:hypothetical protein [Halomicroarcula sp. S3CR25-11]MDS0284762.1 hypothetical protein [Halomicroarcula sp. S3CR25-11]
MSKPVDVPPDLLPEGQQTIGTQFRARAAGRVRWGEPTEVLNTPDLPTIDRVVIYDDKAAVPYTESGGEYQTGCDISDVAEYVETVYDEARATDPAFYADIGVPLRGDTP